MKETTVTPKGSLPSLVMVEAVITDEVKPHSVILTRPVAALNEPPRAVSGAGVVISNEDSLWQLAEYPPNSGIYRTPASFNARLQKNYTLLITLGEEVYSAKAVMNPGKLFGELVYKRQEETGLYYIDWVANAFSTEDAAMWELLLDWSMVPGYTHLDTLQNHARMLFYTLPTLDVSEVFAPMMQAVTFPAGTVITERRYSLTRPHAEFVRGMLLETNWTGGLFPVAPANVGTNLSEGAFGYFGACAVTQLSVTVEGKKTPD